MEISIVEFSQVKADSNSFRIDSEHYRKEYLSVRERLVEKGSRELKELISSPVMTGHTPSMKNERYYDGNINFVKTDNLREHCIEGNFADKLTLEGNNVIKRSSLRENDVLVTIIGATFRIVGRSCLVKKKDLPANINQNIALIRTNSDITPEYLTVYLNSYYGRNSLWYLSRQTEQVNLNCREVEQLLVPRITDALQDEIVRLHTKAYSLYEESDVLHKDAEQIILSELSLLDWYPKHKLSFIKDFSDTQSAGRTDAEYFQPMYEDIERTIKGYKEGCDLLRNQFKQNKMTFGIIPQKDYQYIEISCVNISDGSMTPLQLQGNELPVNAKIRLFKDDVIVSKVRPYRGAIGIVNGNDLVGSGAFTVLQENGEINKETLMVFLRSKPMLSYSLKFNTGTSYPTITDDDVLNFPIPIIDQKIQAQIRSKIEAAIKSKHISREILNIAKRGVELVIEENEARAREWIDAKIAAFDMRAMLNIKAD